MTAVWLRFRVDVRRRWRSWLALGLLAGAAAGAVLALAAGARRTDRAYAAFVRAQAASDFVVVSYSEDGTAVFDFDELARLPSIRDSAHADFEYVGFGAAGGSPGFARTDDASSIDRVRLIDGRLPHPRRADEIALGFDLAAANELRVGSSVPFAEDVPEPGTAAFDALPAGHRTDVARMYEAIPGLRMTVVGIVAAPGEFPPAVQGIQCCVHLSPAFSDLGIAGGEVLSVRLRPGATHERAFLAALERRSRGQPIDLIDRRGDAARVQRSIHVQAVGLWVLAALTTLVTTLVVGQLLARASATAADDHQTLDALGMTRRQRFGLGLLRAAAVGVVAGVAALATAIAFSPFFPRGVARYADLEHGLHLDGPVVLGGGLVTVAVVVLLAAFPAWRAARVVRAESSATGATKPGTVASWSARLFGAPQVAVGIRMGLDRGRGQTAVPVATSVVAIALGVAALVGSLTFGASLDHLLDTPALYGKTWDLAVTNFEQEPPLAKTLLPVLQARDDVTAVALFDAGIDLRTRDTALGAVAFEPVQGGLGAAITRGRAPGRGEVVLGATTMRRLGVDIGDSIPVRRPGVDYQQTLRIVGAVVLPAIAENAQLGIGGALNYFDAAALDDPTIDPARAAERAGLAMRLRDGVPTDRVIRELSASLCRDSQAVALGCGVYPVPIGAPVDIVNFGRLQNLPVLLGGVLAVLAVATLAHVVVTGTRRRRRDLAILQALGFTDRGVIATVVATATTLCAITLVLAVPAGIIAGRWMWTLRASDLGIANAPRVPWPTIGLVVAAAFLLASIIALLVGRAATGVRPAAVLRSE